jgi:dihydroorotate dehydrogenase electron transfer subunit
MRKQQARAQVLHNRKVGPRHFLLSFRCGEIAATASPGQFLMARVTDTFSPILRRPFGVHALEKDIVSILFEVIGQATELLSAKRPGDTISVIGPLGKGFDLHGNKRNVFVRNPLLIAGGMGVAPLLFLAQKLAAAKPGQRMPIVLLGARSASSVLCEKDFRKLGCTVKVATDDGSKGFRGFVTGLLEQSLGADSVIYGCGPAPMLKETASIARKARVPAQLSLEAHMSCGFGACMGCTVDTTSGYKRVCREGPVFGAEEIVWSSR